MPTYKVTDPKTGRALRLTGDSPPTEQELNEIFSKYGVEKERGIGEKLLGSGEVAATMATGALAQPVAGLAGIARTILSGPEAGAARVEQLQNELTYKPQTEVGKEYAAGLAEAPVISDIAQGMERGAQYAGDKTVELTGSPALGALAKGTISAIPDALGAAVPAGAAARQLTKATESTVAGAEDAVRAARLTDDANLTSSETVKALKSGKIRNIAEIVDADPKFYEALDELGITEKPLASYASNNPQFRGIEQSFAALPNSPQNAQALDFARGVSNVAQALAEKYDATDSVGRSLQWREAALKNIDNLGEAADVAYSALNDVVDKRAPAVPTNTKNFLEDSTKNLALGIDDPDVPSVLRQAYQSLQPRRLETESGVQMIPPTYENLDMLRRKIGAAAFKSEGEFKDAEKAILTKLYGKLTDDVNAMAESQGLGEQVKAAKSLVAQRKGMEEQLQTLIGNKLQKDIVPVIQQGAKALAGGGAQRFNEVMKNIPDPKLREELLITAINDMFTKTTKGEKQLATTDYLKWYNDTLKKGVSRELIAKNLPDDALKTLDSLAVISEGIAKATAQKIPTGVVNSVLNDEAGMLARMTGKALKFSPVGGETVSMIADVLTRKTDRTNATKELLADPQFQRLIERGVRQGVINGNRATNNLRLAEKRMKQTAKYQKWAKTLSEDEAKLASLGLTQFLLSPSEQNNESNK